MKSTVFFKIFTDLAFKKSFFLLGHSVMFLKLEPSSIFHVRLNFNVYNVSITHWGTFIIYILFFKKWWRVYEFGAAAYFALKLGINPTRHRYLRSISQSNLDNYWVLHKTCITSKGNIHHRRSKNVTKGLVVHWIANDSWRASGNSPEIIQIKLFT